MRNLAVQVSDGICSKARSESTQPHPRRHTKRSFPTPTLHRCSNELYKFPTGSVPKHVQRARNHILVGTQNGVFPPLHFPVVYSIFRKPANKVQQLIFSVIAAEVFEVNLDFFKSFNNGFKFVTGQTIAHGSVIPSQIQ